MRRVHGIPFESAATIARPVSIAFILLQHGKPAIRRFDPAQNILAAVF
jgi:hypothetical protein